MNKTDLDTRPAKPAIRIRVGLSAICTVLVLCLWASPVDIAQAGKAPQTLPTKSITVVLDDNYPPFIFRSTSGQLQGILKDRWALWSRRTGIAVNLQAMDWAKAQQAILDGQADVIDTMFITDERTRIYEFGEPYATIDVPLFFHRNISGITDADSLHGFTVGVKAGDACVDVLRKHKIDSIKNYPSYSAIVAAAAAGDVRVFCIDKPPAVYLLNQLGIAHEFRQSVPLYIGQFHRAVLKGNPALLKVVEDGFDKITDSERLSIEQKWYGTPVEGPTYAKYIRYAGYAAAFALLLFGVLAFWSFTLSRRVRAKTSEIEAKSAWQKAVMDYAGHALVSTTPEGIIQTFNPAAERMLGYLAKEVIGSTPAVFHDPVEVVEHAKMLSGALGVDIEPGFEVFVAEARRHLPNEHEWTYVRKDGTRIPVMLSVTALMDGHGSITGFLGIALDITKQKNAQAALQSALRDQTALLSEVHHRVKNNLQVVSSLLSLEGRRAGSASTRSVLGDMRGRIHAMAQLHESLYRSGVFADVDLGAYIKQLSSSAFRAHLTRPDDIQLQVDVVEVKVDMDKALPCGLMVNELISNCLKHGFPEGKVGEIRVELALVDDGHSVRLTVSDNGRGLNADFESRRGNSLGLQLVSDLVGQLDGTLEIGPEPVAMFSVTFAVK